MAIRPIDANELYQIEKLLDTAIVRQDKVALNLLEQVLYDIQHVPTLTPPNEWVSVEEKLPEKDGSYLVHSGKSNTVYAAHFGKRDGRWSGKSKNLFITHWMPMPELPERSNNETD